MLTLGGSAVAADNNDLKKTVLLWYHAFDGNNPILLDQILDENWVDIPSPPGQPTGPAAAKATLAGLRAAFPDFAIKVNDVLRDGNKVIVRSTISGTQRGAFLGLPSTGRAILIQAVDIHEFKNAKIVRTWHTEDWMSGLRQLEQLKAPQQ
jgi:steroid delta-isomerase-like uncharacterized protein